LLFENFDMLRFVTITFFFLTLFASTCLGAEPSNGVVSSPVETAGLTVLDWSIIVVYAASTIGLGWYFSRRQESTDEYFVGSRNMNPILIGVSLFATLLSTISYLSMPGESFGKGPVTMSSVLALPVVFLLVGFGLLPIYMKQRVTSAYELLEVKLGLSIRILGATMFVVLRLVWMALLIFLTSKALVTMMGVSENWIPLISLINGFIAVIYTSMGGLRAVVITDFLQTILLYGGALLVLGMISYDLGGFSWFPTEWNPDWDTQPFFSTDPSTRATFVGTILTYIVWSTCTAGGDQTSVQRFMATKDARSARKAFATQLTVTVIVTLTLGLVGFALLGYSKAHPGYIPQDLTADKVFPHFIAFHLPPGISGLVVSAMFAAAMSSIDSGVNSITAVVMTDGFDRFGRAPQTDRQHVLTARWLAFGIGAFVVLLSSTMGLIPGNITAVTNKTSNLLTTPIFGLFFFALFVPFASPKGVWIGAICGTTTAVLIAFSGPIFRCAYHLYSYFYLGSWGEDLFLDAQGENVDPISFQWIAPSAITVNIVTGCLGSLLFPRKDKVD
jgi:solute:Na+ symporter, SSS family